jgi:hypothetical protein
VLFWGLVLAGVFVLGIGFGKTIGGGDSAGSKKVTVTNDRGQITQTLPTKTVTSTKTQTVVKRVTTKQSTRRR